ncbi:MAG: DUF2017 family protein [Acidimicrobiia bacterium]
MAGVRFRRLRRGGIEARLETGEAAVLIQLCRELGGLWDSAGERPPEDDAVLNRLFPRAYLDPTAEEAEAEWRRFAQPDLVEGRKEAAETFLRTLAGAKQHRGALEVTLSPEEAEVWLAVVNDARLALGTRLEVTEETHPADFAPDDPAMAPFAVYWWLGYVQEYLVDTLASGMDG